MKIMFVVPNYHCGGMEAIQGPLMNLGPLFAASGVIKAGHEAAFLDCTAERLDATACMERIEAWGPDVVGFAARTHLVNESGRMAKEVKRRFAGVKVLFGGIHATFMHQEIMDDHPAVDFILRGEAEVTTGMLMDALNAQAPLDSIPGLVWRQDGQITENPTADPMKELDSYRPAYHLIENWDLYRNHINGKRSAVVQFARGCVQKCRFCSQWKFWDTWRACSAQVFADEVESLYRDYGIRYFLMADEAPQADRETWEALLDALIAKNLEGAIFGTCARTKDIVRDHDIIDRYAKAGFVLMLLGAEFTANKTLKAANKEARTEHTINAISLIRGAGMIAMVDIMLGWNNDEGEVLETLDNLPALGADYVCFFWTTPYPWTTAFDELSNRYGASKDYDTHNFMTFLGDGVDQRKMERKLIGFYFLYHFNPLRLFGGWFRGPAPRRTMYRQMFTLGTRRCLAQMLPWLARFIEPRADVKMMHWCKQDTRWKSGTVPGKNA
ncbi:MAG: cobalamin-dependent protein [Magnetovibrio sp.]|nr:cobalamin-dependent protein [Magnetovibrio sp.]